MPTQHKIEQVAALKEQVEQASAFYFLDFTGVGVNDFNATRRRLKEVGARVKVVKNRLALRAMVESGIAEEVADYLRGPTSLVLAVEDSVAPARIIRDIAKKLEALKVKGAYVDGTFYPADQFGYIASLPTKDELRGQVVGVLVAPIWELASSLESLISDLVYVLDQLKDRGGEGPAAA